MKTKIRGDVVLGISVRLLLLALFSPKLQTNLYLPFLSHLHTGFQPWSGFTSPQIGESPFPYGLPMYLLMIPTIIIGKFIGVKSLFIATVVGFGLTSLVADGLVYRFLCKETKGSLPRYLWLFNPIVLWSTYILGQTDLWPALFILVSGIQLVKYKRYTTAGIFLGLAIGCKYGAALVIPFFVVYALDNPRYTKQIRKYLASAVITFAICYFPALYSPSFADLTFRSQKLNSVFSLNLNLGDTQFLLAPATYFLLLIWIYRAGRTSPTVLMLFTAIGLMTIVLFTPNAFGWIVWSLPILLTFLDVSKKRFLPIFSVFMMLYILGKGINNNSEYSTVYRFKPLWNFLISPEMNSLIFTTLLIYSVFLVIRLLQWAVYQGDIYGLGVRPFLFSISGDSGVGKDTLANAIGRGFGSTASIVICGDDYHLFERGDYVWGSQTHLNPRMNDLEAWTRDIRKAIARDLREVINYNHTNGRFEFKSNLKSADLVISQGLHANTLMTEDSRMSRVHLQMDESLRVEMKIRRDINQRKRTKAEIVEQLKSRQKDHDLYILKQSLSADLLIKLKSKNDDRNINSIEISSEARAQFISRVEKIILTHCPQFFISGHGQDNYILSLSNEILERDVAEAILRTNLTSFDQFFPLGPNLADESMRLLQVICYLLIDETHARDVGYPIESN